MATYIVNTQVSNLNVRKFPGTDAAIVGKLAKGTEIEVENIDNGWARIEFNGATAYVSADYVKAKEISNDDLDALKF